MWLSFLLLATAGVSGDLRWVAGSGIRKKREQRRGDQAAKLRRKIAARVNLYEVGSWSLGLNWPFRFGESVAQPGPEQVQPWVQAVVLGQDGVGIGLSLSRLRMVARRQCCRKIPKKEPEAEEAKKRWLERACGWPSERMNASQGRPSCFTG